MKIVIIGGSGRIGSRVTELVRERGHDAVPASPRSGVNAVTGEGLAEALAGADVVVDVANSPTFDADAAMDFFRQSGRNLLRVGAASGVRHHVALSVVGTERLTAMGYFNAKLAQEDMIGRSGTPHTIVRATQFFEFIGAIAESGGEGDTVLASSAMMQPIASDDVASAIVDVALSAPANGKVEVAGPEPFAIHDVVGRYLRAQSDRRSVITGEGATYFGLNLGPTDLMPGPGARLGPTRFEDWVHRVQPQSQQPAR